MPRVVDHGNGTGVATGPHGFYAFCSACAWRGPLRSVLSDTHADRIDHLITSAGAPPIVVPREPRWSPYP